MSTKPGRVRLNAYYRSIMPMEKLHQKHSDEVEVRFELNPLGRKPDGTGWIPDWDFEAMHWADIIMVNNISNFGGPYTARIVGKAKEFGKFVHFDTDDLLTNLYDEHRLKDVYEKGGLSQMTEFIYQHCDLVTVTQEKFAHRISPHCRNILAVVKNAIDYDLPNWNLPKKPSKKVRIGWAGGIHHDPDVKEFASVPALVNQKVGREKIWWDFYGHPPMPKDGNKDWQWDVWKGYKAHLLKGFKGPGNWTIHYALPPQAYGMFYANMDIAVAPLQMNEFNDSKSDIKVAEAGRYKVPLIASDVGCYNETIVNGETGYLLDTNASVMDWVKVLTKVIKDKQHREEMGANLHKITEENFNINKVVGERLELYKRTFEDVGDPRK